MTFQTNGYLAPGFHDWTIEEVKSRLVDSFPASSTRSAIMDGYDNLRALSSSFGIDSEHWLDGSYCSHKTDPGDLDLVIAADLHKLNALPQLSQQLWTLLVNGPNTKATFHCDSYFLPVVPANDPLESFCEQRRLYWAKQFGADRLGTPKGMVRLTISKNSTTGGTP